MNIRIPMKMEKATNWLTSCSCSSSSVVPTTNIWNGETFIVQLCMTGGLVADAVTTFVRDGDSLFVAGLFWVTIPFGRDRMMSQHRHARPWKPDIWIYDYNLAYTIWHALLINLKKHNMTYIQEPQLFRCTIIHRCTYQLVKKAHNAGGNHVIFHFRPKPRETRARTHTHTYI